MALLIETGAAFVGDVAVVDNSDEARKRTKEILKDGQMRTYKTW
jgi:hypothetical protein